MSFQTIRIRRMMFQSVDWVGIYSVENDTRFTYYVRHHLIPLDNENESVEERMDRHGVFENHDLSFMKSKILKAIHDMLANDLVDVVDIPVKLEPYFTCKTNQNVVSIDQAT